MPSTSRPSTWRWLCSFAVLAAALPAAADASYWPAQGGGPARTAAQEIEPGELPAVVAWSHAGADPATAPIVTGGDGPFAQRVAYGTADGRVHLRVLATGAEVGPPGGTLVADAAVTDVAAALVVAFASSSTEREPGVLFVVHEDGGGIEVARFDEVTGQRLGFDTALPGGLGCDLTGAPLLTPAAADGTRLLFFVIEGPCAAGEGLVRVPVETDGTLGTPATGLVDNPAPAPPALVVAAQQFLVAVGRPGGLDLFAAGGTLAQREMGVELVAGSPVTVAADGHELVVLAEGDAGAQLYRVTLSGTPRVTASAALPGAATGLAVGADRVAAATSTGLHVLTDGLETVASAPGDAPPPALSGAYAFQAGRAVQLADGAISELPPASASPAIARGFVLFGPLALATRDVTAPAITPERGLAATVADDRGVAGVRFTVAGRRLAGRTGGSAWAPARYTTAVPRTVAPGSHRVAIRATDMAGNVAFTSVRLRVACDRSRRGRGGPDRLRGGPRRDCVNARSGSDLVAVAGGGADRVRCGPGRDTVRADRADRVGRDCERITRRGGQ